MTDTALITTSKNLPECYKNSDNLTLDQIDARNVTIEVAYKKTYRTPRVRIGNSVIRAYFHPHLSILLAKQLLALAVEGRRRLRHPKNQSHVTTFKGPAWGTLTAPDGKHLDSLVITIEGKLVSTVTLAQLTEELDRNKKSKEAQSDDQPRVVLA